MKAVAWLLVVGAAALAAGGCGGGGSNAKGKEIKDPLRFTGPVLADIFMGKIKKWNDKALQDLNPGVELPDLDIVVVHRSDGSGTTYVFADYLAKVSEDWKSKVGVGTSLNWPVGIGQKGNEAVARQVKQSPGGIGYIELTYALQNDIKYGLVRNKAGEYVKGSVESVTAAADNALKDLPEDLRYSITDADGKGSYPISGTSWALAYVNQPKDKGKAVVDFLRWCAHDGQQLTGALHYAQLPKGLVERLDKRLDLVKVAGGGDVKRLNAGGATFIFPMMSKWASEYNKAKGIEVNYQSIGSGGGIQQMTAQTFDFGCSDGPMNNEQLEKARQVNGEVVHIPLVMGAVVPAYNLGAK